MMDVHVLKGFAGTFLWEVLPISRVEAVEKDTVLGGTATTSAEEVVDGCFEITVKKSKLFHAYISKILKHKCNKKLQD